MTHLPDAEAAVVDEIKIRDYLLNAAHSQNGGKAAYFHAFGFDQADHRLLRTALLRHAAVNHIAERSASAHGRKFVVRFFIETPDGRNPCISTVCIIEGSLPPRLVTAYP